MNIKFKIDNNFLIEKKDYVSALEANFGYTRFCGNKEIFINRGSPLALHLTNIEVRVNVSNYPEIEVDVNSFFVGKKILKVFAEDLIEDLKIGRPRLGCGRPGWGLLRANTFGGIAELLSRLVVPSLILVIWGLLVYIYLCYELILQVADELRNKPPLGTGYLSYDQVSPSIVDLYASGHSFFEAAILLGLLSGGWYLGLQVLISCILIGLNCKRSIKILLGLFFVGSLFSLFYGTFYSQIVVLFSFFVGYFLFGFYCRCLPYFRKVT